MVGFYTWFILCPFDFQVNSLTIEACAREHGRDRQNLRYPTGDFGASDSVTNLKIKDLAGKRRVRPGFVSHV